MTGGALPVGSTVGILGGGQLGRMLAAAAFRLGLKVHVFCPPGDAPACETTARTTRADYDDVVALDDFAAAVDVVTTEFENVPASTLERLARQVRVAPAAAAVAIAQDRLDEKSFVRSAGIETAPFAPVPAGDGAALRAAVAAVGGPPCLFKSRRLGYDGKGQVRLEDAASVERLVAQPPAVEGIVEGFVDFDCELSVLVARPAGGGASVCFEPSRNLHTDQILRTATLPTGLPESVLEQARAVAIQLAESLDYVGLFCIEFFVAKDGRLLVNELAPRVHNSGHWTLDACTIDQFEQHVRAICGWPLVAPRRLCAVVMHNLIGEDVQAVPTLAARNDVALHLYGKGDVLPGRKMGHYNVLGP